MRDKFVQFAFGIFVATFLYCLLVLHTVHGGARANVPGLAVSMAFYLAIIAGATLIFFTHHIAGMIAAPSIIAEVGEEMDAAIGRTWPERVRGESRQEEPTGHDLPISEGGEITAATSGYIQTLDTKRLAAIALEHDALIKMLRRPGDYLFTGIAIARIWPADAVQNDLADKIRRSMVVGKRRTPVQDLGFAFNQLAEIAVRAMSPALNDPFTALDCVNRIGAGIARLARRSEPSPYHRDERGELRLIAEPVRFDELLAEVFAPVRNYSRQSVIVTLQMLRVLEDLAPLLQDGEQRRVAAREATLIRRGAEQGLTEKRDRQAAQRNYEATMRALGIETESFDNS